MHSTVIGKELFLKMCLNFLSKISFYNVYKMVFVVNNCVNCKSFQILYHIKYAKIRELNCLHPIFLSIKKCKTTVMRPFLMLYRFSLYSACYGEEKIMKVI